jgi:hypothetical protein
MLYKERGRGRLSVLIETGEERVLSPSASHTQKQQNKKMPSHLIHTASRSSDLTQHHRSLASALAISCFTT